jgi:hypothetical protein
MKFDVPKDPRHRYFNPLEKLSFLNKKVDFLRNRLLMSPSSTIALAIYSLRAAYF